MGIGLNNFSGQIIPWQPWGQLFSFWILQRWLFSEMEAQASSPRWGEADLVVPCLLYVLPKCLMKKKTLKIVCVHHENVLWLTSILSVSIPPMQYPSVLLGKKRAQFMVSCFFVSTQQTTWFQSWVKCALSKSFPSSCWICKIFSNQRGEMSELGECRIFLLGWK